MSDNAVAGMDESKEVKEEDGGNILDDILNTKEEKFEDEETTTTTKVGIKEEEEEEEAAEEGERKDEEDEENAKTKEDLAKDGVKEERSDISDDTDGSDNEEEDGADNSRSDSGLSASKKGSESDTDSDEEDGEDKKNAKDGGDKKVKEEKKETSPGDEDKEGDDDDEAAKKKKKGKSYDYATKLNYLFRDARFFLVKSNNPENVTLSKAKGVWSTPPQNEAKFNQAFAESRNVLLIYSVKESGKFCGLARLSTESRRDGPQVSWVLPPGLSAKALGGVFAVDWICRIDLSFQKVQHLYNPWNEGKPVKIGRDGQEVEPRVAEELCRLFPIDPNVDMTPILRKSKEAARQQRAKGPIRRSGPIGGRTMRGGGGGPPRGRGGGGFDRGRKRGRYEDEMGPRQKMGRYDDRRREPFRGHPRYDERPDSRRASYTDYLRSLQQQRPPPAAPPAYSFPPSSYLPPPPPRYYDGPPLPDYGRANRTSDRSYDRSVDEFLRRTTSERPRERDSRDARRYRR